MRCNVAIWDRVLRFLIGVLLVTYAIAGGPMWAYIGFYGLLTAAWGLCPLYAFWGIKTLKEFNRHSRHKE